MKMGYLPLARFGGTMQLTKVNSLWVVAALIFKGQPDWRYRHPLERPAVLQADPTRKAQAPFAR
jgi:hypothetical protein